MSDHGVGFPSTYDITINDHRIQDWKLITSSLENIVVTRCRVLGDKTFGDTLEKNIEN